MASKILKTSVRIDWPFASTERYSFCLKYQHLKQGRNKGKIYNMAYGE